MTFADFLESLFSRLDRIPDTGERTSRTPGSRPKTMPQHVEALKSAPIFHLGSWPEIVEAIEQVRADLVEDLAEGLMAPFPNLAIAFETTKGWALEWIFQREAEVPNRFVHTYFSEHQREAHFRNDIEFEFAGKKDGHFQVRLAPESVRRYCQVDSRPEEQITADMGKIIEDALLRAALISHPSHYLVERSPRLTPREERRAWAGEPIPYRKRPHFIVIDHEDLLQLHPGTKSSEGPHRSPVPHARRGHWMRLSDRCRAARAAGKAKVWIRDTFVGEREFADQSNRYKLFFSAKDLVEGTPEA